MEVDVVAPATVTALPLAWALDLACSSPASRAFPAGEEPNARTLALTACRAAPARSAGLSGWGSVGWRAVACAAWVVDAAAAGAARPHASSAPAAVTSAFAVLPRSARDRTGC